MQIKKYLRILSNLLHVRMPHYVIFYVTSQCNSRCPHCFYWKQIRKFNKAKELSLDEIQKIANNFSKLEQVSLTGGEPFLREDLPEICEIWSKTCNTSFFTIPTNGILSEKIKNKTEDILKRCPDTHLRISLSLDGIGELHDKLRGVRGNFNKLMGTYAMLSPLRKKYSNLSIDVSTVIQKGNQDKIIEILEWTEKNLKIDNHMLIYPRGMPKKSNVKDVSLENYAISHNFLKNKKMKKEHRPFSSVLRSVFEVSREVIAKTVEKNRMIVPCTAGKRLVVISENGNVYPCEILNKSFGNVRDVNYNIKKLLYSKQGKSIKSFIKNSACYCTFECAVNTNVIFNLKMYPRLILATLKNMLYKK